jgi:hypothetical protein
LKFIFPKPTCDGQECFADYRYKSSGSKVYGRVLFPGERYCLYGSKVRRFKKSDAIFRVPRWCPKYHRNPIIRVYVRAPETLVQFMRRMDAGDDWDPPMFEKDFVLRVVTSTPYTPLQLFKELSSGLCDYDDLISYEPEKFCVVEIDNGVTAAFLYLNKDYKWIQIYFDKTKCDDGSVGRYAIKPHENLHLDRYSHETEEYLQACVGYMRGYFAEERFQGNWQDNRQDLALPSMWNEYETFLETLKVDGFLRSTQSMQDYCLRFPAGELDGGRQEYGYMVETKAHNFFIRCLPHDESYNVFIYVYSA